MQDTNSGVNGGVQAGYNYQTGCTLFGVEADWAWSDTNASSFNSDGDGACWHAWRRYIDGLQAALHAL